MIDWQPFFITFQLAFITTFFLFFLALPLAYYLAFSKSFFKVILEALVSMPLILPPTVLGFYLLLVLSPNSFLGSFLDTYLGLRLIFSFEGLIVASMIYSLPFMVQPIQSGLQNLPQSYQEAAYVLGKSKLTTFWKVLLPNIRPSILTAITLSFAHTIGEFGVVLMIGGNIPNETRVVSIAIYDEVESLNYATANIYAGILFAVSLGILLLVYGWNKNYS